MPKRKLWERPVLHYEEDLDEHRSVSWLELFFDLFFVVCIAQLTHGLAAHPSWSAFGEFVLLFIPIWWVWIGFTYYNERFESNGLENRLFTFALMVPVIGLAAFAHGAMDETFMGFALSYVGARIVVTYLWLRATIYVKEFRETGFRLVGGFILHIILIVASVFCDAPVRYWLFAFALLTELILPLTTIPHQAKLPKFSTSKLPECFGLFVIIVLGEMVVGVVSGLAAEEHVELHLFFDAIFGVALGLSMWWIYFDFIARRPPKVGAGWAFAWGYLHMPLVIAIAAIGAGVSNMIGHHGDFSNAVVQILSTSVAIALITMALLEMTLHHAEDEPTHAKMSPGFKIIGALLALIIGWSGLVTNPPLLMLLLFSTMLIQMVYGAWSWFTQELPESISDLDSFEIE